MAVKEANDQVPINYENEGGWHTVGRAITTKGTDESKGWSNELANYQKGITNKNQIGY
tara:strand:- start:66 stop:239 length:174 start_codon:yes stop_codon:yes gene_type:complete